MGWFFAFTIFAPTFRFPFGISSFCLFARGVHFAQVSASIQVVFANLLPLTTTYCSTHSSRLHPFLCVCSCKVTGLVEALEKKVFCKAYK